LQVEAVVVVLLRQAFDVILLERVLILSDNVVLAMMLSAGFMMSNGAMKPNRVGLSEYTARRLAELRARRAEADDTGGISIGVSSSSSSSTAAAETTVNDTDSSTVPPAATAQPSTTQTAYSRPAADSNTAAHASSASQLPSSSDLSSSSNLPKTTSQSVSAPTAAVSVNNGVSEGLPDTADVSAKSKQLWSEKLESGLTSEQRRIDRQDVSNARAAAVEPSRLPVQRREVPQPSPFARTGFQSNDAVSSGGALEVGALNKMASFYSCMFLYKDFRLT